MVDSLLSWTTATPLQFNTGEGTLRHACMCVMQMQESEDEQLAKAIAASLGQETTSLPPAQPPSQATAVSTSSALVRH